MQKNIDDGLNTLEIYLVCKVLLLQMTMKITGYESQFAQFAKMFVGYLICLSLLHYVYPTNIGGIRACYCLYTPADE